MPLTKDERAEINRQNAQKSTGPRSDAGKAASRANALKHGLAATTIEPLNIPGEPVGAYQQRLDYWIANTQPQNVLELALIQRACRASWKLDRCVRYEDAAIIVREAQGGAAGQPDRSAWKQSASELGACLMFQLNRVDYAYPQPYPVPDDDYGRFDNAPRDADALCSFQEGVEWLLDAWHVVLANLPDDGDQPTTLASLTNAYPERNKAPEVGSAEFHRRVKLRAIRLLGIPTGAPPPAQPLREAGEAEVRRLKALFDARAARPVNHLNADLSLFSDSPEAQLLMRYEAQADRELHRSITTFAKLRKELDLVPADAPVPSAEAPPSTPPENAPSLVSEAALQVTAEAAARNEAIVQSRQYQAPTGDRLKVDVGGPLSRFRKPAKR